MKIALDCHSLLLTHVLESYLQDFLCPLDKCDFILSDHSVDKPVKTTYLIGSGEDAHIGVPFTRESLLESLQELYSQKTQAESLESKVQALLGEYTHKLLALIQEYRP
ncbi:hypothetical protein ACFOPX_04835 [Helicobacter baculiformis]|uniref:JHP0747 family n=1 Tax=Helicobacter baculiformis TaxID=427351 RepID=A0ABV7ZJA0_9HELI|nr:hypothetical protein [Helicobacter baculiformis]